MIANKTFKFSVLGLIMSSYWGQIVNDGNGNVAHADHNSNANAFAGGPGIDGAAWGGPGGTINQRHNDIAFAAQNLLHLNALNPQVQ
jgi:hypothetical protein